MDIRDHNEIAIKLGIRMKEIDALISELPFIAKLALGENT